MPPCPAPDTCWLYLIRHGATANNCARPPRLQGHKVNLGLSAEGVEQARRTGLLLADRHIDAVYTSPLLRASETAKAVAAPHGLKVEPVEELIEVDVGRWEGMSWDEIKRTHLEAYRLFAADAAVNGYLGGENLSEVRARVTPAFDRLMAGNTGRTIVAVAHNIVNRAYIAHLLEMPLGNYRAIPQDNCGVNLIRYRNGDAKAITINAVGHLVCTF